MAEIRSLSTMRQNLTRPEVVNGLWKFRDTVTIETLLEHALEWRATEPDKYQHLYIRQCGPNMNCIGFQYVTDEKEKKFFHRMSHKLKKQFGKHLVGWDVSSPTLVIV
jgi:hypothetical protein